MKTFPVLIAIAGSIAIASACSDNTSSGGSGGAAGATGGAAGATGGAAGATGGAAGMAGGAGTDGGATITVSGTVREQTISGGTTTASPLEGASVCLYQHADVPCTTSAADGTFALAGVPQNSEGAITFAKSGYQPQIWPGTTGTADLSDLLPALLSTSTATTLYAALGTTYTSGTSTALYPIAYYDNFGGVSGTTFAITPSSGQGPFYGHYGIPDNTLTETNASGAATWTNVTPGDVEVTITPPSGVTCSTLLGWASTKPDTLRTTVVAGYATFADFGCM